MAILEPAGAGGRTAARARRNRDSPAGTTRCASRQRICPRTRADTILRSVRSVQAQTFADWELLIGRRLDRPDHGPRVRPDARIRVIRQGNGASRRAQHRPGQRRLCWPFRLRRQWLPHHLELCTTSARAFPEQQFVTTELREDLGDGRTVRHYHVETSVVPPEVARGESVRTP
jgi:hypothetical protein